MRLILVGILLFVANSVLAQNRESLIVATDRLTDSLCVIDSIDSSRLLQVFQVKCDTTDFVFMGMLVLPSSKNVVSLFSQRNSPEHLTRYYYYDFVAKRLYITPYFSEAEVPSFFSLDVAKQELFYVSIHRKEPGTFLKKSVSMAEYKGPVYLRFGRPAVPNFTPEDQEFEIGKAVVLTEGEDVTIFATGHLVWKALEAAEILAEDDISVEVINIHTIKPLDKKAVLRSVGKTRAVVTAEEHMLFNPKIPVRSS